MKGSFPRCWKCGHEWASCYDHTFVPIDQRQATYNQQTGQPPPWDGQWHGSNSGSWSPRSRTRRSSNRGRKSNKNQGSWQGGDLQYPPKGNGKGQEQLAPAQVPMQPFMPFPAMMPQIHQQMMQPPLPPPMNDKGAGKGVPPPPPMMPTIGVPATGMAHPVPTMPWGSIGQTIPFPAAPSCPAAVPEPTATHKPDGPAQQKLNRLLKEMKKEEDNLSPHLQAIAHEMQKQDEKNNIKNLSSAVRSLGEAKQELLEAENARAQHLSQWKTFLQQTVVKWREFATSFHASESAHQQGVQAARVAVKRAQRVFDLASKKEQAGQEGTVTISDEEGDNDVADDTMEDPHDESVQRIHQGMDSLVSSLEELSSTADQLEQRVKRPRVSPSDGNVASTPAPHFGAPGAV